MPDTTFHCFSSKSAESHASKSAKDARRRRRELRRIRSLPLSTSAAAVEDDTPPSLRRKTSYGKISVVGRRREMHDAVAVELGFLKRGGESYDFFGVFEGHRVGRACCERLAEEADQRERAWEEVIREAFQKVAPLMGLGSVAVVGETEVAVAGSKAVLCRGGEAVRLLESNEEAVAAAEKVKVRVLRRSGEDEFLILGSDGFWDVISDHLPYQIATRYCSGGAAAALDDGAEKAVAVMAEMALAQGSKHNVSVVLVDLRQPNAIQQSGLCDT